MYEPVNCISLALETNAESPDTVFCTGASTTEVLFWPVVYRSQQSVVKAALPL